MADLAEAVSGKEESNVLSYIEKTSDLMSRTAGAIRNSRRIAEAMEEVKALSDDFSARIRISSKSQLPWVYRLRDMLISMQCYMTAMIDYTEKGGKSRDSKRA